MYLEINDCLIEVNNIKGVSDTMSITESEANFIKLIENTENVLFLIHRVI